ncbi:ribonuclease BN [Clostridiales bacterium]|nr:ribonuclease BN [Clostridiales bacterium]
MQLTVLMDNNTHIDQYYAGEPAVSYFIEDGSRKILFDAAYSGVFMKNAKAMGIQLEDVTDIVISHGHNDHTGGLKELFKTSFKKRPLFTSHPDVFLKRNENGLDIGSPVTREYIAQRAELRLTKKPIKISENIMFLGEIPDVYERRYAIGKCEKNGHWTDDFLFDDSALVYIDGDSIFIITGCSHSGICNIIEYGKSITGRGKVSGVIGGLHLFENNSDTLKTIEFLRKENIPVIYPCHCTSFKVRAAMSQYMNLEEVGVGMRIWRECHD